jgi:hypothetical protein
VKRNVLITHLQKGKNGLHISLELDDDDDDDDDEKKEVEFNGRITS